MSNLWFTSDQHFGHAKILGFCDRPFKDVDEMDREMIERWNAVVEPDDIVYHLGDFTLNGYEYAKEIFLQLNGMIYILSLPWHHDKRWLDKAQTKPHMSQGGDWYVRKMRPMLVLDLSPRVTLCHYPLASWEASYHGAWHLHGHSHGQYDGGGFMMDVGVDSNNFAPVSLKEVRAFMKTREGQPHPRMGTPLASLPKDMAS